MGVDDALELAVEVLARERAQLVKDAADRDAIVPMVLPASAGGDQEATSGGAMVTDGRLVGVGVAEDDARGGRQLVEPARGRRVGGGLGRGQLGGQRDPDRRDGGSEVERPAVDSAVPAGLGPAGRGVDRGGGAPSAAMLLLPDATAGVQRDSEARARVWFAQAIRGAAAMIVVWYHLTDSMFRFWAGNSEYLLLPANPPLDPPVPAFVSLGFNLGALGVGLFFLTSGFVIPFSFGRRTLGGFFLRRLFRLYPVHWLGLTVILSIVAWRSEQLGVPMRYTPMTILVNAALINQYLGHATINLLTWTLVVEELFYASAALLAWRNLLDRRSVLLGIAAIILLGSVIGPSVLPSTGRRVQIAGDALLYYAPFVVYILIGVACHWWYRGRWTTRGALTTGAILWVFYVVSQLANQYLVNGSISADVRVALEAHVVALALFVGLMAWRDRLPQYAVLDWLAQISYPMYVFHQFVGAELLYVLSRGTGGSLLALVMTVAILLALTSAIHVYIEDPCNELGRRLSARLGWERRRDRTIDAVIAAAPKTEGSGDPPGVPSDRPTHQRTV